MHRIRCLILTIVAVAVVGCAATGGGSPPPAAAPAATGAAAPAATAASAAPALVPMRLGLNTVSANIAPVWVAKDEGFFARYGIDAELMPIPGGERVVSALISGD